MAVAAKRKTDRVEAPGAPLSGRFRYEIDLDHTRLGFAARYMGVATVRGEFRSFTGYAEVDPQQPSTVECRIAVDPISLDTGVVDRDNHLMSVKFLDSDHSATSGYFAHAVPLMGDDYLIALDLDATPLRRRGQGPTAGHPSAGC